MSDIVLKACIKCKQSFPATREFFYSSQKSKDGLNGRCKTCFYIRNRKVPEGFKTCPECKQDLPLTKEYFHFKSNSSNGFHSPCKKCRSEKPWRPPNEQSRKRINVRQRTYRLSRVEIARGYQRRYKDSDLGRKNAMIHYNDIRARQKRYYESEHGQEVFKVARRNRRARKRNAPGKHTASEIRQQYERQKGQCYYCNVKVQKGEYHVEHIVPLSRGGSNDISNIVISCATCNLKKHNKLPHEWPEGGRLL